METLGEEDLQFELDQLRGLATTHIRLLRAREEDKPTQQRVFDSQLRSYLRWSFVTNGHPLRAALGATAKLIRGATPREARGALHNMLRQCSEDILTALPFVQRRRVVVGMVLHVAVRTLGKALILAHLGKQHQQEVHRGIRSDEEMQEVVSLSHSLQALANPRGQLWAALDSAVACVRHATVLCKSETTPTSRSRASSFDESYESYLDTHSFRSALLREHALDESSVSVREQHSLTTTLVEVMKRMSPYWSPRAHAVVSLLEHLAPLHLLCASLPSKNESQDTQLEHALLLVCDGNTMDTKDIGPLYADERLAAVALLAEALSRLSGASDHGD